MAAQLPEMTGVMQQRAAEHRIKLENERKADISLEGGRTGTGSYLPRTGPAPDTETLSQTQTHNSHNATATTLC